MGFNTRNKMRTRKYYSKLQVDIKLNGFNIVDRDLVKFLENKCFIEDNINVLNKLNSFNVVDIESLPINYTKDLVYGEENINSVSDFKGFSITDYTYPVTYIEKNVYSEDSINSINEFEGLIIEVYSSEDDSYISEGVYG